MHLANPRHEAFAQALARGRSNIDAHRAAGYRPHRSNASHLARSHNVSARVADLQAQAAETEAKALGIATEKLALTKEKVLAEFMRIAFSDIGDVVDWMDGALVVKDSGRLHKDVRAAVSEVSISNNGAVRVKMHSKQDALTKLGEHLGLFKQQVAIKGNLEVATTDAASARRILMDRLAQVAARLGAHGNRSCADGHAGATCAAGDGPLDRRGETRVEERAAEPFALVER